MCSIQIHKVYDWDNLPVIRFKGSYRFRSTFRIQVDSTQIATHYEDFFVSANRTGEKYIYWFLVLEHLTCSVIE